MSPARTPTPLLVARAAPRPIPACLHRAAVALRGRQREDGRWACDTDMGPVGLATTIISERLFRPIAAEDVDPALTYFARRQREDGSFDAFPGARTGSLSATALCLAAMRSLGVEGDRHAVFAHAHRWLDGRGGMRTVVRSFAERGDVAPLYLHAAGLVDGDFLPRLPPGLALAAHGRVLQRRVHSGSVMTMLVLAALADRQGAGARGLFGAARRALQSAAIGDYLCRWQNEDGSWNGSPLQTSLVLVGLHAAGMSGHDVPIRRALDWLDSMKRRRDGELDLSAMDNDVWSTALCALALHAAGEPTDQAAIDSAVRYLLSVQTRQPMPRENQRRIGAVRVGGWPFQRGNETMPDTDDTGVVVAALSELSGERASREVFAAIDRGVRWLRDMQNADGGYPTFVWGLPSKPPGPMFTRDMPVKLDDPAALVRSFLEPAPEYGDPALEGVTGRVLWGLGRAGVGRDDPAVCGAIDFLRRQQNADGSWWGRWKACYLAETATILLGLHAVGEDMQADYVRRATSWIVSCRNEDGGFGEGPEAYTDRTKAGQGPSSAAVTAYVLLGLLAAEEGASDTARDAARWLVDHQGDDGLWANDGWLHTFIPPDLLYVYEVPAQALPVIALARYDQQAPA